MVEKSEEVSSAWFHHGLLGITRSMLTDARRKGAVALTYHYSHSIINWGTVRPYMHFETGKSFSRNDLPDQHADALHRCHEFIISRGKPALVSKFLPIFRKAEPVIASAVFTAAQELGVHDHYMVPVYGPHQINGVVAFGFAQTVDEADLGFLSSLEAIASHYHTQIVRNFEHTLFQGHLSERESEVLQWISRGKSNGEIATIIGVSGSTVDTYVRRLFVKLGAHDRVTATLIGLANGMVRLDKELIQGS